MKPILVWRFSDAPEQYKALSPFGGDEDWLALVPVEMKDDYIPWLENGNGGFGVCDTIQYVTDDGIVHIGCHA